MLRICGVIIALFFIQPVLAGDSVDQKCSDDRGKDRCGVDAQAATRNAYGLADIDAVAAEGTYARRAMMVDGYGNDVLAVSFIRQKGNDPFVEIRGKRLAGAKDARSIRMPISIAGWNDVLAKGAYFDRDFAPKLNKNGKAELANICLHSWMVTVEAADPERLTPDTLPAMGMPPELRRKTQSACDGGLAMDYAFQLADMAYDMLPVCQAIDADLHRNKVMALNACLLLSGDRAAAGHALSLSNGISKAMNIYPEDVAQTEKALTQLIVLPDPNNRPKAGSNRISQGKRAELVELLRQGDIYNQTYKGIDADHVEIDAIQVQRSENPDGTKWPQRKLTIFASREAGEFRIYAIEATEFKIVQIANASDEE